MIAFASTTLALGGDNPRPQLRANLPVAALPAISLASAHATAINNVIGENASISGITAESYTQVRRVGETAVGTLYLIPGTHGACLFLAFAAACGDPGAPESPFTALVTLDSTGRLVGGGVADTTVRRVEVLAGSQARVSVPVTDGLFTVSLAAPHFKPGDGVKFIAH